MSSLFCTLLLIVSFLTPSAHAPVNCQTGNSLAIRVEKGEWGVARIEDIQLVLYSAGNELVIFFPSKGLSPIIVGHREANPRTLFERGNNGEYIVLLSAVDRKWAKFAYQFSHELCHILSNYENTKLSQNAWFDEALAETASLFTLRRMAITWETHAPYATWNDYASALGEYADETMSESYRQLPSNKTLAQWFAENRRTLKQEQDLGQKEELVANNLLPLLERNPGSWEAISYLNLGAPASESFEEHLGSWYRRAPQKHRKFVEEVANLFGVRMTL